VFARVALVAIGLTAPAVAIAQTAGAPLVLETKIPLGDVSGRIDHLAIDLPRQRLLVAELGNNSLGVVDLRAAKLLRTIFGMDEPQGVAYVPSVDSVYVANGGDGSVRVLRADDFTPTGRIELGNDADNVRVDVARNRVLVGYGNGALAVIDPASRTKIADLRLNGHPEGFQLDEATSQIFVNVPDARQIEIVDLASKASQYLPTRDAGSNFPMAIDRDGRRVLVVFRNPPRLVAVSIQDRRVIGKLDTCSDADDLFVDPRRQRVYVSCGEGVVDVLEQREREYRRLARLSTVSGARTSVFVPELDRLFVAVRARSNEPAAIWVFRPAP
jgi:DNA-binding beta-propeller fold protein YncE